MRKDVHFCTCIFVMICLLMLFLLFVANMTQISFEKDKHLHWRIQIYEQIIFIGNSGLENHKP